MVLRVEGVRESGEVLAASDVMDKISFYLGSDPRGPAAIPLFTGKTDGYFEKIAAPSLMPEVVRYIENLKARADAQYVLINAMGAGEYWGSNINGDYFPEVALIHRPEDWTGNPLIDRIKSKTWPYGFPTFYNAKPFLHHRNKDFPPHNHPAFGEVELALWNPKMKRVELVNRVDRDACLKSGGMGIWDKLKNGEYPDVSMGCFTAGTRVTMSDGSRKVIEDVQVGDLVLTHRGRARRCTATHRRPYKGDLYSLKAEATPVIHCTRQHPFRVVQEDQVKERNDGWDMVWRPQLLLHPGWVHAECLGLSHYALAPIPNEDGPEQPDRISARLLGYYLAEGHPLRNKAGDLCGIELTTNIDDAVHQEIDQLCEEFGTKNPPAFAPRKNSENAVAVYIHDARLAAMCVRLAGVYSKQKRLAGEVLLWNPEMQLELAGAYANGDGCGPEDGSLKWSTSSEALAWQLQLILARSGLLASVSKIHHKPSKLVPKETDEWVVHLGKQHARRLREFSAKVRPVEVFKTKNSRMVGWEGREPSVLTPLRSIDAIYAEIEVFNLEVEEDESYLVEGLAVHNCKVPFDMCSICLDWDAYRKALATFDPSRHKSPGEAALEVHKKKNIRGVSITRNDYCEHAKNLMNRILPDGRKVFVYNDFPRFFDISFVFIGADKTAKVMMKIAEDENFTPVARAFYGVPSGTATYSPELDMMGGGADQSTKPEEAEQAKMASAEEALKFAFLGKLAKNKSGEIDKNVIPSQFAGKAIPLLTQKEPDLPKDILDALSAKSPEEALTTATGLGVVLRPHEFQKMMLKNLGHHSLADQLEEDGVVFPKTEEEAPLHLDSSQFSDVLAKLLLPLLMARSAFAPFIERRCVMIVAGPSEGQEKRGSSLSTPLLRKIGAAYNGYRRQMLSLIPESQSILSRSNLGEESLVKLAHHPVDELFTHLSAAYLRDAFIDEVGEPTIKQADAGVERGFPSRNTRDLANLYGGSPCPE